MKTVREQKEICHRRGRRWGTRSLPVNAKKHIFQSSASITITPILFSGSDGTAQAIAAGETWETSAPLSGFKSDTAASVYWVGEYE